MDLSRRDFLATGTAAAGATLAGAPASATPVMLAQAGPAPRGFDPADAALKYEPRDRQRGRARSVAAAARQARRRDQERPDRRALVDADRGGAQRPALRRRQPP